MDDEYKWAGVEDPKVMVTTSRDPSARLKMFAKVVLMSILLIYLCPFYLVTHSQTSCKTTHWVFKRECLLTTGSEADIPRSPADEQRKPRS